MADQKYDLQEFKADGEDSNVMDPVTPAGGSPKGKNRKADMSKSVDPTVDNIEDDVKTPQGTAASKESPVKGSVSAKQAPPRRADKRGMGEAVEKMFEGQDLSEDFKEKASVVFEAALNERLNEELEAMSEEFETKLQEQTIAAVEELVEKVDSYLDYVVEKWMEENEVAIENGIRTEIAESFMKGLANLFVEHNLNISDEEADLVAEMASQLEEMNDALNEMINTNMELQESLSKAFAEDVFEEVAEGLSANQAEKFKSLIEGISYENIDDLRRKAEIIKENYFGSDETLTETREVDNTIESLNEEGSQQAHSVDPDIDWIAKNIGRSKKY